MISINYTSPSLLFGHFEKKQKKKEMLINQIVSVYSTNDHDPSSCKYFNAVK